ncbi:MAG TPA: hypothetical protein VF508_03040, partial [Pyrinomonadaceae bacterium]
MQRRNILRAVAPCVLAAGLFGACASEPRPVSEERPAAPATPAAAATPAATTAPQAVATPAAAPAAPAPANAARPPDPAQVRAALERTYKGALAADTAAAQPVVGDFNGDGSEDLVVAARPAPGRVDELNDDLANWIVYDPLTVRPPDPRLFDPHG